MGTGGSTRSPSTANHYISHYYVLNSRASQRLATIIIALLCTLALLLFSMPSPSADIIQPGTSSQSVTATSSLTGGSSGQTVDTDTADDADAAADDDDDDDDDDNGQQGAASKGLRRLHAEEREGGDGDGKGSGEGSGGEEGDGSEVEGEGERAKQQEVSSADEQQRKKKKRRGRKVKVGGAAEEGHGEKKGKSAAAADSGKRPAAPDDPELFEFEPQVRDWDSQRLQYIKDHPGSNETKGGRPLVLMLSASDPNECAEKKGDFLLMKLMKNKGDYARLHEMMSFYSLSPLDPRFDLYWCKLPLVRSMMLSHPQVEWIFWVDSDAVFTDMAFELPLEKYGDKMMVLHGVEKDVLVDSNWVGLNAGIFLLRNCQESLDFINQWGGFATPGPIRSKWGEIFGNLLKGRTGWPADDQAALVWLLSLSKQSSRWQRRIFLENTFFMHGYWQNFVDRFEEMQEKTEGREPGGWFSPFITHFVGCKLCSRQWATYDMDKCANGIARAFNFADNQVMKTFGYKHKTLEDALVERVGDGGQPS